MKGYFPQKHIFINNQVINNLELLRYFLPTENSYFLINATVHEKITAEMISAVAANSID